MARILAIGIATIDMIHHVAEYPGEDAEVRALGQDVRRGGNATNSLVVLSQLGHQCSWGGVLVDGPQSDPVTADLSRYGIDTDYCTRLSSGTMPTSFISLSRSTGSRTIVHYRDLPEYTSTAFARIPLDKFDWIHFEGRNVDETLLMLQRVRESAPAVPVSVEIEKPRPGIERLFGLAGLLLFSRAYIGSESSAIGDQLRALQSRAPGTALVCALGEQGAIGLDRQGELVELAARPPARVVDTLAAGDTFNAGMIDSLSRGYEFCDALAFAVALAGAKCGQAGLDELHVPGRAVRGGC